jgi:hypothetical protein
MFTPEALASKQTRAGGSAVTPNTHVVTVSAQKEYIAIYDVQTPSSITQTATYDLSAVEGGSGRINGLNRGGSAGVASCNMPLHVVNGVVYFGINTSVYAYDVSDPTTITELGSLDLSSSGALDITMCLRNMQHDDRLFALERFTGATNPQMFLIDISDPSSMTELGDVSISEFSGQNEVNYISAASGYDSDSYTDGFVAVPIDRGVRGYEVSGASRAGLSLIWSEDHATNSSAATSRIIGIDICTGLYADSVYQSCVSFYEGGKVAFTYNGSSTNTPITNAGVLDDPRGIRALEYMSNYTGDLAAFCVAAYDDDALVILTNPDSNGPITVRVDQYDSALNGVQNIDVYDEWIYCASLVYQGFSMWELTGSTSVTLGGSKQDTTYLGQGFQVGVIQ